MKQGNLQLTNTVCYESAKALMSRKPVRWFSIIRVAVIALIIQGAFVFSSYAQTLTTDQYDYAPGSTATITGCGFQPGETVVVQVLHYYGPTDSSAGHTPWPVTVGANGCFTTTWCVCEPDVVNSTFIATAVGQTSGLQASVLFSDAVTGGAGLVANFGVDGDLYANKLQFGYFHFNTPPFSPPMTNFGTDTAGLTHQVGTDDWFSKITSYPGIGVGVIDTTGAAALKIAAAANPSIAQIFHSKYPPFTIIHGPFPTPGIGGPPDALPPIMILDGVAARDGLSPDAGVFLGSNKNGDDPSTWQVGPQNVQSKDDLLDVGGHLRIDLTDQTYSPTGSLWGFAFATRKSTNGDSHVDFEIFRSNLTYTGSALVNFGPDAGHTAGLFNPTTGFMYQGGDLILLTDYTNGGGVPNPTIAMWVDPTHLNGAANPAFSIAQFNALPPAQRPFTFTGITYSGPSPYVYAAITTKATSPVPFVFQRENDVPITSGGTTNTLATPWGNQPTGTATERDSIQQIQFVEVGVNFTALGLQPPSSGPCATIFGTLMVKTRSSQSFQATLEDFAGPFLFGAFTSVIVHAHAVDSINCTHATATVCATASSSFQGPIGYCWQGPNSATGACLSTDSCFTTSIPGKYFVTVNVNNGCTVTDSIIIAGHFDNTPPTITCPPATSFQCGQSLPPCLTLAQFLAAGGTATDNAGGSGIKASTFNCSTSLISGGTCGTYTRTYSIQDSCGNQNSCTQTISVTDNTPPVITATGNPLNGVITGCNPNQATIDAALGSATASDNCSQATPVQSNGSIASNGCNRTQVRSWIATDACGNTATTSRTATWTSDLSAPSIAATGNPASGVIAACNPDQATIGAALGSATFTDNCGPLTPTATPGTDGAITSSGCTRTQTRTWNVTDGCGNTASTSRTATWTSDLTPPTLSATGNPVSGVIAACNPNQATISAALGSATFTDNCGPLNPTSTPGTDGSITSSGCSRTQTRTWNVTDGCGNTASTSRTATWTSDLTAPTITATGNPASGVIAGCNPDQATISAALGSATFTDNCGPLTPTATPGADGAITSSGCTRTQTRTWNVTDGCGNTASTSRTATWTSDLTAPSIAATGNPASGVIAACNPDQATINAALGSATFTDNCGSLTPTSTPGTDGAITSSGCTRTQTRTWNATDGCGNTASTSRTATWTSDLTAPSIATTGNPVSGVIATCNPDQATINAALGSATFTDNCGPLTPTATTGTNGAITSSGCTRSQTRTWNVTDGCGNTASTSRTATWTSDLTAPTIAATGNPASGVIATCNPDQATINGALGSATFTDNCGPLTPTSTPGTDGAITSSGCTRTQTRIWNVTDGCGNTASTSRTATWTSDLTAPSIATSGNPVSGVIAACNPDQATINAALGAATFTDNCGPLTPTATPGTDGAITSSGCARTQTRTWNITDGCGNTASTSRTATWTSDLTAPAISATGNPASGVIAVCNPDQATINAALGSATFTDNCGPLTPTSTPGTDGTIISSGCTRTQTRTWNVTDGCGNTASTSRTATWNANTQAPVITATGNPASGVIAACNPDQPTINAALGSATASASCGAVIPTPSDGAIISSGCTRTQTRTWNVTDGCGNTASTSRTATWTSDLTAPAIATSGNPASGVIAACNPDQATINAALGSATFTDNCGPLTPTSTPGTNGAITSSGCTRIQTRTWNVTDGCGNTASTSRTATWTSDLTAPTITATGNPASGVISACNPDQATISAALGSATFTDNCGPLTPTSTPGTDGSITSSGCTRTQTRTWNVTDGCGNTASTSRTATWTSDLTAPSLATTGNPASGVIATCNPDQATINSALGSATFTDNCGPLTPTATTGTNGAITSSGCTRTQTRTWNVTDGCGNTASAIRTATWTSDVTAPTITTGGNPSNGIIAGCNPSQLLIDAALGTATFTDNCGPLTPTATSGTNGAITSSGCTRTQTRTWNVTDGCGNTASTSRTATWTSDLTLPVFSPCPTDITQGLCHNVINYNASATDNCTGSPSITYVFTGATTGSGTGTGSGSTFNVGTTVVTLSAMDDCGNIGTCIFSVTIVPNPNCSLNAPNPKPFCSSTGNALCVPFTAGISYQWSIVSGAGWSLTSRTDSNCVVYTTGSGDPAVIKLVVTNVYGCKDSCTLNDTCLSSFWGCTLGFWKNHSQIWDQPSDPISLCLANALTALGGPYSGNGTSNSSFATTFGLTAAQMTAVGYMPNLTLLQALNLGGGGFLKLARQGVAALLNTCGLSGHYQYTSNQVITSIHNAVIAHTAEPLASQLGSANETLPDNCPPGGRATHPALRYGIIADDNVTISSYPNPFSTKTTIEFTFVENTEGVTVDVYSLKGEKVAVLFQGNAEANKTYQLEFNADKLVDGVYIYKVSTHDNLYYSKLILIK